MDQAAWSEGILLRAVRVHAKRSEGNMQIGAREILLMGARAILLIGVRNILLIGVRGI